MELLRFFLVAAIYAPACCPRRSPHDVPISPCTFQLFELFPSLSAVLNFFHGNHSKQKQFAKAVTCAMPTQTIAARACWQAILRFLRPTFIALNNVVYFPVSIWSFAPTAILKLDWVAAKMAVPACFVVNFPQILFVHHCSSWHTSRSCAHHAWPYKAQYRPFSAALQDCSRLGE